MKSIDLPPHYGVFYYDDVSGPIAKSPNEDLLVALVRLIKPMIAVEIGVLYGETTACLAWHLPVGGVLYGLDVNVERPRLILDTLNLWEKVRLIEGTSQQTIQSLPNNIEFAYIDGDHGYSSVKADVAAILPKMAANGLMAFHDMTAPQTPTTEPAKADPPPVVTEPARVVREMFPCYIEFSQLYGLALVQVKR